MQDLIKQEGKYRRKKFVNLLLRTGESALIFEHSGYHLKQKETILSPNG